MLGRFTTGASLSLAPQGLDSQGAKSPSRLAIFSLAPLGGGCSGRGEPDFRGHGWKMADVAVVDTALDSVAALQRTTLPKSTSLLVQRPLGWRGGG